MKYTNGEFVIDADYEKELRNKVDAYQRETGTEDTLAQGVECPGVNVGWSGPGVPLLEIGLRNRP